MWAEGGGRVPVLTEEGLTDSWHYESGIFFNRFLVKEKATEKKKKKRDRSGAFS